MQDRQLNIMGVHAPATEGREDSSRPNVTFGMLAELRAAELLIERGHCVAKPIVDDVGVDLIVGYNRTKPITVQIKSSRAEHSPGLWKFREFKDYAQADVVMFHARPIDAWWICPSRLVVPRCSILVHSARTRPVRQDKKINLEGWRDAWELFDGDWGTE